MCIHTVYVHIEGCWTPHIQGIPPEPYLDLEKTQHAAVQYHVLVNAFLVCGTYGNIYCDNLLNLTADGMTATLNSVHHPDVHLMFIWTSVPDCPQVA